MAQCDAIDRYRISDGITPASLPTRYNGHALHAQRLLRGARGPGRRLRHVLGVEPGRVAPTLLVVVGHALLGQRHHPVERARAARVPHALDADVLVVAGVVDLVELVAAAELGPDRVPQQLHDLDALAIAHAV